MNFIPRGELGPQGWNQSPRRNVHPFVHPFCLEEWRGEQIISPPGDKTHPWGTTSPLDQSLPLGAKLRMGPWPDSISRDRKRRRFHLTTPPGRVFYAKSNGHGMGHSGGVFVFRLSAYQSPNMIHAVKGFLSIQWDNYRVNIIFNMILFTNIKGSDVLHYVATWNICRLRFMNM
jgi:hypothetical protein